MDGFAVGACTTWHGCHSPTARRVQTPVTAVAEPAWSGTNWPVWSPTHLVPSFSTRGIYGSMSWSIWNICYRCRSDVWMQPMMDGTTWIRKLHNLFIQPAYLPDTIHPSNSTLHQCEIERINSIHRCVAQGYARNRQPIPTIYTIFAKFPFQMQNVWTFFFHFNRL